MSGMYTNTLHSMTGIEAISPINSCDGNIGSTIITEYMHGLFGLNNWHSSGGQGPYTFIGASSAFCTTANDPNVSQCPCGFDRNHLGWKFSNRTHLISSLDAANLNEVNTDITIQNTPNGGEFILRDFMTIGDLIRIKLPHIDNTGYNTVKNQYLWLENHQKISMHEVPALNPTCATSWGKGLWSYIQVGKDRTKGVDPSDQIFCENEDVQDANGSGSWLQMLPAEGRFDYHYRPDLAETGVNADCIWGNNSLPVEKGRSLNNPLTGFHDLFNFYDWNGDGEILLRHNSNHNLNEDTFFPSYTEVDNTGVLHHTLFGRGDDKDIFTLSGNHKIAIGTNPSTAPLYTYSSYAENSVGTDHRLYTYAQIQNQQFYPFENRTIYLNNLSIEILSETVNSTIPNGMDGNPSKDLKIRVKWDDADVNNVRWCGNIVLQDDVNDPLARHTKINLLPSGIILLERGQSPTQHIKVNGSFTQPTVLTLKSGSETNIGSNAIMNVNDDSKLMVESAANLTIDNLGIINFNSTEKSVFKSGSNIHLKDDSRIYVNANSTLEIEQGVNITLDDNASIVVGSGGKLIMGDGQVFLNGSNASVYIKGTLEIPANTDLTMNGTGFYQFGVGNNIVLNQGSKIDIVGSSRNYHNMIKIDDHAKIMLQNHNVKLEQGRIVYGLNSKIEVNGGGSLNVNNVTTVNYGVTAPYKGEAAIDVSNTHNVLISNCIIDDFVDGIKVHDYALDCVGYNGKPFVKIENCNFNLNGNSDIKVNNMQNTNVLIQGCTLANQNNYGDNGLDLSHCNKVELISSIISNKKRDGIKAENVNQLLVNSTHIFSNLSNGIEANNANVYVRNGSVVELNVNDGISLNNGGNTLANATSSLTIGDWGCAWIIHNGGYAINGSDFFLYADAREHSILNGSNVKPNRFDDNSINTGTGMSINICYTFPFWNDKANEIIISSTTLRQNYWGGSNYRYIGHVGFQPSTSGGIGCNFLIPNLPASFLDDGGFLTSLPVSTGACTFTTFDPNEVAPYDPTNISGRMSHTPVEIPQELIDATLASEEPAGKIFSMAYRKMLGDNIDEATFMLTDYLSVADPSVMPDSRFETTQALADKLAIQLYALDPCTSPYEPIPNSSRVIKRNQIKQAIAAKALKNSSSTGIKIFPNPFESSTTVSFTNEAKETFVCTVYNMQGQSVKTMQNIESNNFTIDASLMPKGMYWIELKSKTKSYREKLVVE
jgi:hypothetical protein